MWSLSSIFKLSTAKMGFFPGNHIILIQKNTGLCKCPSFAKVTKAKHFHSLWRELFYHGCFIVQTIRLAQAIRRLSDCKSETFAPELVRKRVSPVGNKSWINCWSVPSMPFFTSSIAVSPRSMAAIKLNSHFSRLIGFLHYLCNL